MYKVRLFLLMALPPFLLILRMLVSCGGGEEESSAVPFTLHESQEALNISTSRIELAIKKNPLHITLMAQGNTILRERAFPDRSSICFRDSDQTYYLTKIIEVRLLSDRVILICMTTDGAPATLSISFPDQGTFFLELTPPHPSSTERVSESFYSPRDELIYGLTERLVDDYMKPFLCTLLDSEVAPREIGSLNRRGERVSIRVIYTEGIYAPFYQTSKGYGLFVEGTMPGRYDIATEEEETIRFEFDFSPYQGSFRYHVFYGPSHYEILRQYTAIVGRPFLPPEWAFKHSRYRDEHEKGCGAILDGVLMNAQLVDDIFNYERLGIPPGTYTFDRPWTSGDTTGSEPGFADLAWDSSRFPNAEKMIESLRKRGYHVFVWLAPWAVGTNGAEARERGYIVPSSNRSIDFTNPQAVAWWQGKLKPLIDMGISGFKLDRGDEDPIEPEDEFYDGRKGSEVRNDYPTLYAKAHYEFLRRELDTDFFTYMRAGYSSTPHYSIFWSGDVTAADFVGFGRGTDLGLRSSIIMLQRLGFMGYPIWGSETGGYYQFKDRDVFARWLEFSAFCPFMHIGGKGTHAPWDMPTSPAYDEAMIDIYRTYVKIHHALVPYIYRYAGEAHENGRPIAKALVFNYPNDPDVLDLWDEFLLGDDILVAPVWRTGQLAREVYLPEGLWMDLWAKDTIIKGPVRITADAPLNRIPVYVHPDSQVLDLLRHVLP